MLFPIYMSDTGITFLVLLGVVLFFGALIVAIILLKKKFSSLQINKDAPKSEEEAAKEELDRILVPIEDEETLKQMEQKEEEKKD